MDPVSDTVPQAGFDHPALLYHDRDQYLAAVVAFIHTAQAAGQPTLVAVPSENLALIRSASGVDVGTTFIDMSLAGRNPGRILPGVLVDFADRHPDRRIAVIGEPVWPARSEIEYPACVIHEALINTVFAGRNATILCPYDVTRLSARAVRDAYRTHPVMQQGSRRWPSDTYTDPARLVEEYNVPLPDPPSHAAHFTYTSPTDLEGVRAALATQANRVGLIGRPATSLLVAVSELMANSIDHTAGGGQLAIWLEDDMLVCQVQDGGHLRDLLAGRIPPPANRPRGRGLLLVNALCDLVRTYTRPGRTVVRIHQRLSPAGAGPV